MNAAVVIVEGASDRRAVEVAAGLLGVDLVAAGVAVVGMGGVTNLARTLHRVGCRETFFACVEDLEDELIRALGPVRVHDVIAAAGDGASYAILTHQPFHRGRPEREVLRRFMGTTSGRKLKYAGLLTAALTPGELPAPLVSVLATAVRRAQVAGRSHRRRTPAPPRSALAPGGRRRPPTTAS